MGAWTFVRERIQELLPAGTALGYAGRRASASPAVGSGRIHRREQAAVLEAAFAGLE
jgi:2-oxoglutarate dehydrogenase E1 component